MSGLRTHVPDQNLILNWGRKLIQKKDERRREFDWKKFAFYITDNIIL